MTSRATVTWSLSGTHLETCGCETGHHRVALTEPTGNTCAALLGWHIDDGHVDGVRLTGLNAALAATWAGPVAPESRTVALYLDERASGKQADALTRVFTGRLGGHPRQLARHLGDVVAIIGIRLDFDPGDGHQWRMRIHDQTRDWELSDTTGSCTPFTYRA